MIVCSSVRPSTRSIKRLAALSLGFAVSTLGVLVIWVSGLDLGIERNHKNKSVSGIVVFVFLSRRYVCLLVRPSVPPVLVVRPSPVRSSARTNAAEVCATTNALEESAGAPLFQQIDKGASCAGEP